MMACKDCGGEVIAENLSRICIECGIVQDNHSETTSFLFEEPSRFQEGASYIEHHENISTKAFKSFKELYFSITYILNSSYAVVERGKHLLPKLYDYCKKLHEPTKYSLLTALLFYLHQQDGSFTIKQFQSRLGFDSRHFNRALMKVKVMFGFSSHLNIEDYLNNTLDIIGKLSKIVLKPNIRKSIETSDLITVANRLASTIHSKTWIEASSDKFYVEKVSSVSIVIASHYCISCVADRKGIRGKKKSFRYSCIEFDEVANFVAVSKRRLHQWIKVQQEQLYKIYNQMYVKPSVVEHHREIGLILVDILDYIDLDLSDHVEISDEDNAEFVQTKSFFLKCLNEFLNAAEFESNNSEFPWHSFLTCLQNQQSESKALKDLKCEYKPTESHICIGVHKFHIEHVKLIKSLLLQGCTVRELESDQMSKLIRTYLEGDNDEEDEISDSEIDSYIKKPNEL